MLKSFMWPSFQNFFLDVRMRSLSSNLDIPDLRFLVYVTNVSTKIKQII